MNDECKTKKQLIHELFELRIRNAELERAKAEYLLSEKTIKGPQSDLKATMDTLKENEERYRLLAENTDSLICEISAASIILFVNSAFKEILGYDREELLGRSVIEIIQPDEAQEAVNEFTILLQNRVPSKREWRIRQKNGACLWFECIGNVFETISGETHFVIVSTNINERKIMEEELRKAKEVIEGNALRLKTIFESMIDSLIIFNSKGVVTDVNQKTISELGFDPTMESGETLGKRIPLYHLNGKKVTRDELPAIRASKGEKVIDEYYRYKNIYGREFVIIYSAAPLVSDGEIYAVVSTWHDITERETLLAQLEKERIRLQAILEQLPFGVVITEVPSGEFILCNKQVEQIWRHPPLIATSNNIYAEYKGFLPEGHPYLQIESALLRSISKDEVIVKEEINFQRYDQSWGILEFSSAPIKEEGKTIAGVTVFSDITERKQIEEDLRLTNQLQQIIEFLPDATLVLDQNKSVIAWNRAIEIMTGVDKHELLGKKNQEYSIPFFGKKCPMLIDYIWDKETIGSEYKSVIRENDFIYARFSVNTLPSGQERFFEAKASPLKNSQGQIIGAIECIRDITRQQEMEDESLKAQKIESIGVLAGGIAHDFNNLLTGILANIQLARMKLERGQDITNSFLVLEDTIKQAANLTRQLLTFSKGGAPVKKVTCLNDILKDSAEFVISGSKSKCSFTIPDDLWAVDADSGQISQVISNMVINADQAMPNGGLIRIAAENIIIRKEDMLAVDPGKYIRISIADTGVGIPKETIGKIFDPYFTTKKIGNGLGLATCYFIVSRHNGHISVESSPGAGTVFHIYLPALDYIPASGLKTEVCLIAGFGKVLLMDDEKTICEAAGEMLSEIGYEVEYVHEGSEAIDLYLKAQQAGKPFDAIIMDLTIPGGLGGKETVKRLLEIDPEIKAIVSSGYSNDPVMANYTDYGFSGVVTKPFKIEELNQVLKNVLMKRMS